MQKALTFQQVILKLSEFWESKGCVIWYPHHEMVGAGTNNPATLLRVLGPEPLNIAYMEPSFRPDDGRYCDNPNRVQMHHQFQVIIKPVPYNIQDLYLESLEYIGLSQTKNDIRFVEDNWESPTFGAWGLGWEVWLNGLEITQYTYFQQAASLTLSPPACELTYGLERIVMNLQGKDSLWDIDWNDSLTYKELLDQTELEFCKYNFEHATVERTQKQFEDLVAEAENALKNDLPIPAYDFACRISHNFNILDARGAVGVAERAKIFGLTRKLVKQIGEKYVEVRESRGFPLAEKNNKHWETLNEKHFPKPTENLLNDESSKSLHCVIELGFEELASFFPPLVIEKLENNINSKLEESRIEASKVKVLASPRRLALIWENIATKQASATIEVKGPRRDICEKNPKAIEGFLRKNKAQNDDVFYKEEKGAEYAFVKVQLETESLTSVFQKIIPEVLSDLPSGRTMRWLKDSKVAFNRPLRWILALAEDKVIPFEFADIKANKFTCNGRWEKTKFIPIGNSKDFVNTLKNNGIIVDQAIRTDNIKEQLYASAKECGGNITLSDSLLSELCYLCEDPQVFTAKLDKELLTVPDFLISAVIEKHIRCVLVRDDSNNPLPYFLGVSNGQKENLSTVAKGFEQVAKARLKDALFFIKQDTADKFSSFHEKLSMLTFHTELGSMKNKSDRLEKIAKSSFSLLKSIGSNELNAKDFCKAASICKDDLATSMVTEMTKLQGAMGTHYALLEGTPTNIANAIKDHYLPRFAGDSIPSSEIGLALSIINRLDTLVGFLGLGLEPTGSADPYGLRREALGLVQCLVQGEVDVDLNDIVNIIVKEYESEGVKFKVENLKETINSFIIKRLTGVIKDEGVSPDTIKAITNGNIAIDSPNVLKIYKSALHLNEFRNKEIFIKALPQYIRCVNITNKAKSENLLIASELKPTNINQISSEDESLLNELNSLKRATKIEDALNNVCTLSEAINNFFENTMVMVDDEALRAFRLKLIQNIVEIATPFVKLKELQ